MKYQTDFLTHGVYLVTTTNEDRWSGLTVAWASQVRIDHLMVCIGSQSATRPNILESKVFGFNVLYEDQIELAHLFGRNSSKDTDKFSGEEWFTLKTGSPLLKSSPMVLDCEVVEAFDFGHEKLIIGKIIDKKTTDSDFNPLIYKQNDY